MSIIQDNAVLVKNIKTIGKKRTELVALIQETGMGALFQAMKHKNMNTANDLVVAVGAGMKQQALVLWLCEFGPFTPKVEKEQKEGRFLQYNKDKMPKDDADMDARLKAAAAKEWHAENTERNAVKYLSIANEIHAIIAKYDAGKHTSIVSEMDDAAIEQLRQLAGAMPKVDIKAHAKKQEAEA